MSKIVSGITSLQKNITTLPFMVEPLHRIDCKRLCVLKSIQMTFIEENHLVPIRKSTATGRLARTDLKQETSR